MLIEMLSPDFIHNDERGSLTQLVREGFSQINVVHSNKGVFRGGHYHLENNEAFYVIKGKFTLLAEKENVREEYTFETGDMFLVPKLVTHSFNFSEETWLVGMYDLGVEKDNGEKDIHTGLWEE